MSIFLEPLKLFVSRCPSVIEKASPSFASTKVRHASTYVRIIRNLLFADGQQPRPNESDETFDVDPEEMNGEVANITRDEETTDLPFLETRYGVRLEVTNEEHGVLRVSETSAETQEELPPASDDVQPLYYRYRLFPDWQTSYIWYDMSLSTNIHDIDDPHVNLEVIQERYPILSPYYQAWRQRYETEFERQELHLGSDAEVFPDVADRISWDVEGLMIACSLALQNDVLSVEYIPRSTRYQVEKGTIETDLPDFLLDIMKEEALAEGVRYKLK